METICYDLSLLDNPNNLIATFAHELSHALHNRCREPVDIEPELYELFTDLTAIYLGYGVFLANSRFDFQSTNIGWQASGAGYLPEADMVFALGIFMKVKNIDISIAEPYLKPNLSKMLKKAFKQLTRYEKNIDELKSRVPSTI